MTRNLQAAPDVVERLALGEKAWAATSLAQRGEMLAELRKTLADAADEWVQIACDIKQMPNGSPLVGEEWISGPWAVLSFTAALMDTLAKLDAATTCSPATASAPPPATACPSRCSPHGTFDRLLFSGFRAEVWMRPGVTEAQARSGAGLGQRDPAHTAGVALVLGAGNIFSIAPLDSSTAAVRRQPRGRAQAEPGHRTAAPAAGTDLRAVHRDRCGRDRHRRRALRRRAGRPPRRRGRAHDRQRGHPRRDRLGHRRGGRREQGGRDPAAGQADHQRARGRVAGHRGARRLVAGGPASSRPSTSRPSGCTTAATTASPARS